MGRTTRLSSSRPTWARILTASIVMVGAFIGGADVASAAPPDRGPNPTEDTDQNDGGTPNNVVDSGDDAHPSGRDRSVEQGGSGNQGRAASDPDDNGRGPDRTNGGTDQPNRNGGRDKTDQDGNNGCGNDDDFEDDNEGRCGGGGSTTSLAKAAPKPAPAASSPTVNDSSSKHTCSSRATGMGNGANGPGEYGSTCDGSASNNGNGTGNASGKPCAGCVGSADDKNPHGQRPNGSDRNNGYECDGNSGVGRGNPAHSSCIASVPSQSLSPQKPPTLPPVPPRPSKAPKAPEAAVLGISETAAPGVVVALGGSPVTPAAIGAAGLRGALASTGLPLLALLGLGAAAAGLGGAAFAVRRRLAP